MSDDVLPSRQKQRDFFTCDIFDSFKDDAASMEHPVFSLSTTPDFRVLVYKHNGSTIEIKPSYTGLATIHDKDILLYLASSLMNAKNMGKPIAQVVRFIAYDYLTATNKKTSGIQYQQLKDGLSRLKGTVIKTNIKTNGIEIIREFSLIDEWGIVKEDNNHRMIAVEVKLSDWFYNSILSNAVLSIDKDYFQLRKPTERRLYELARKHCGNQTAWKIKLENLKLKLGITSPTRTLRFNIKKIAETNHLPEYNISIEDDVVIFSRKEPPKENNAPEQLPIHVSKAEIEKNARPGESYEQVAGRLKQLRAKL
jgi:plasmid replication initiation protein